MVSCERVTNGDRGTLSDSSKSNPVCDRCCNRSLMKFKNSIGCNILTKFSFQKCRYRHPKPSATEKNLLTKNCWMSSWHLPTKSVGYVLSSCSYHCRGSGHQLFWSVVNWYQFSNIPNDDKFQICHWWLLLEIIWDPTQQIFSEKGKTSIQKALTTTTVRWCMIIISRHNKLSIHQNIIHHQWRSSLISVVYFRSSLRAVQDGPHWVCIKNTDNAKSISVVVVRYCT